MRKAVAATVLFAVALVACTFALLAPISTSHGASCGSAIFAAKELVNDDSGIYECLTKRDARRGDFTLPLVLSVVALLISGGVTVSIRRSRP